MIDDDRLPLKKRFLEYFRELPVQKLACAYIGRTDDTISLWKAQDPEFSDQINLARAEWAKKNVKAVRSKEWLLERIMRNEFAPRSPLLDDDGKPIPLLSKLDVHNNNSTKETNETK